MSALSLLRRRLGRDDRPLRFLVAGGANTAFGIAVFPLLIFASDWLRQNYLLTLMIAQATSITFAYFTYRIALRGQGISLRQVGFFSGFYLFHCVTNIVLLPVMVELLGMNPVVAQLLFIAVMAVGGYLWHSRVTFAPTPSGGPERP